MIFEYVQEYVIVFVFWKSQFDTLRDKRQGPWWGQRISEYLDSSK